MYSTSKTQDILHMHSEIVVVSSTRNSVTCYDLPLHWTLVCLTRINAITQSS